MTSDRSSDSIRLRHMHDGVEEALCFVKGKTRSSLDTDRILTLALVKQLELIGEAASRISPEFKARFPDIPWKEIIATRNRLVHGYFDIDLNIIWATVDRDLRSLTPLLAKALSHNER